MGNMDKVIEKLQKELHLLKKSQMSNASVLHRGEFAVMKLISKYYIKTGRKPTLVALSERLEITQATVTPLVDRLIKKGLLIKEVSETDKRAKLLSLTDTGKEVLHKQIEQEHAIFKGALEHIGQDDANELVRIVKKINTYFIGNNK